MKAGALIRRRTWCSSSRNARKVILSREEARSEVRGAAQAPGPRRVPIETPLLEKEKKKLEAEVSAQGFARPIGEIEID